MAAPGYLWKLTKTAAREAASWKLGEQDTYAIRRRPAYPIDVQLAKVFGAGVGRGGAAPGDPNREEQEVNTENEGQQPESIERTLGEVATWCVIFGLTAVAFLLFAWMCLASKAGAPPTAVVALGLGALAFQGVAAGVALKFSR